MQKIKISITKSEFTVTNFITYLDFVTLLVGSGIQVDAISFGLNTFDVVAPTAFLRKFCMLLCVMITSLVVT
jgi:hypothetical protein